MKPYKLTVSIRVLDFFDQQAPWARRFIRDSFQLLSESPHNCQNLSERNSTDRDHFVYLRGIFAIKFWIDEAEREVKVIDLCLRDRR